MNNLGLEILKEIGGKENIKNLSQCATRLRFDLFNVDIGQKHKKNIENLQGVLGVMIQGGQYQIIIGPKVNIVYNEINNILQKSNNNSNNNAISSKSVKKSIVSKFMNTVTALFTPLLPLLAGAGILRGIVLIFNNININGSPLLPDTNTTYIILTSASTSVFYFLPILLAITSSKKFNCNTYVAVAIMGAMLMPIYINLMGGNILNPQNGTVDKFIGIPMVLMNYSSTVFPAILIIYAYSKLELYLYKYIPSLLHLSIVPLIALLIMVPIGLFIIGPIGVYLGKGIAYIINHLVNFNGWIAGGVVGGFWNILVIFGIHWAVNPIMIQNISNLGQDFIVPFTAATNFGMAGATFGVFLLTKNAKMKQFSISALFTIFFAGITEPAIYGVGVRYKRPLIAAFIGGAIGGAFMGGFHVYSSAFVFGGLITIPAFAKTISNLVYYCIGLAICFIASTIAMLIIRIKEEDINLLNVEDNKFKTINN